VENASYAKAFQKEKLMSAAYTCLRLDVAYTTMRCVPYNDSSSGRRLHLGTTKHKKLFSGDPENYKSRVLNGYSTISRGCS
jgi:hypothetical protein